MELQKIANESIQRKRKKNAKDFLNFLNENFLAHGIDILYFIG